MGTKFSFGLVDEKVRGINVMLQMRITDYWDLAQDILRKNPFQRRKQRPGDRIYQYLKKDILKGCVILPIVLATTDKYSQRIMEDIEPILSKGVVEKEDLSLIRRLVRKAIQKRELMILDGLQRTYTLEDIFREADEDTIEYLNGRFLRIELFIGLRKSGLLYRMLTLNTGQMPMSFRHQLEIVYSDYVDYDALPEGIRLVREVDKLSAKSTGTYRLSDAIDLYHSYLAGDSSPTDRKTILETITSTDFLDSYDSQSSEDLVALMLLYHHFIQTVERASNGWTFEQEGVLSRPWGRNTYTVFARPQAMTGFGSACRMMIENKAVSGLGDIDAQVGKPLPGPESVQKGLTELLLVMNEITERGYKTKIGNLQREYFRFYFRNFLESQLDGVLDLTLCARTALKEFSKVY